MNQFSIVIYILGISGIITYQASQHIRHHYISGITTYQASQHIRHHYLSGITTYHTSLHMRHHYISCITTYHSSLHIRHHNISGIALHIRHPCGLCARTIATSLLSASLQSAIPIRIHRVCIHLVCDAH